MALFSKKHYIRLAKIAASEIKSAEASASLSTIITTRRVFYHLAEELASDNRAFDRDQFIKACGLEV